ncbi:hypothetical protein NQ318_001491, partial [Aromia moschata]
MFWEYLSIKTLGLFQIPTKFDKGIGALLPEAYKKFYKEWKLTEPTAVHYIPEEGKWKRDDITGEVEVLDKYISVVVTDRTINLINANYGFDHYLLKTPACDIKSLLPLGIKRKILQELEKGCPAYADQPEKQKEILQQYQKYLSSYTTEEIKWYGYSFTEACKILQEQLDSEKKVIPLKHVYRSELIEKLKAAKLVPTSDQPIGDI